MNRIPVGQYIKTICMERKTLVSQIVKDVDANVNIVIVQTGRDISNEIEMRTGIRHASPQAIILKGGKAVYHASHYDITAEDLEKVMSHKL